eukprot:TRINITY_DN28551_c0_g1_i2.p1 TRINITY_DN28551_c0_g1~~TRINITY_DN28551_c0_g1_i2.p1  ORF type:complete len:232 (-),score=23.56 TRINITY_DN28551_c0_g1_i2:164-784(-)
MMPNQQNSGDNPLQKLASLAHGVVQSLQIQLEAKRKEASGEQKAKQVNQEGVVPPLVAFGGVQIPTKPYLSYNQTYSVHKEETTPFSVVSQDELGRSTWTFMHTLAAQFPEKPTRQQQKDTKQLLQCMAKMYPCAECAAHFQKIVSDNPPRVGNGRELRQWTCEVHNTVNRSLGKPVFNCSLIESRWASLDCDDKSACDLTIGRKQ